MLAAGERFDEEVVAEEFSMPETTERFAVHAAIAADDEDRGAWVAAHIESGFAIAFGDTPDEAIAAGRAKWASKTRAERAEALERAMAFRVARRAAKNDEVQP